MRYRVTIRGAGTEIRGYAGPEALALIGRAPGVGDETYLVVASPAGDDYDPFAEQDELRNRVAVLEAELSRALEERP